MKQILVVLLLVAVHICYAQETPELATEPLKLSLEEAIDIGLENNLKLQSQGLDVQIAETQVDQLKAQILPQINANLDYQFTILNSFSKRTSGEEDTTIPPLSGNYPSLSVDQQGDVQGIALESIGFFFSNIGDAFASKHAATGAVGVNQMLFDGAVLVGLKAATVFVDLARVQTKPTERDIRKNVERAYYGVLVAEEGVKILDKNIQNISKLLYDTQKTYEAGFVEQLDVDRLNLSLSLLNNQRKNFVALVDLNYNVLKNTMNMPLSTQVSISETIEEFAQVALSKDILEEVAAPEEWPEFELLGIQSELLELDMERIRKQRLPRVSAFLNGNYNYQGNEFIFNKGWYPNLITGLSVSFPIFDGNYKNNLIKEGQLQVQKIQVDREQLQTSIDIQIQNALTQYLNSKNDVETQYKNIELAEKIYETTQIKYREGVGSSVEMYQAQQELFSAQQSYITALYNVLIAKVDLEQALGK